MKLKISRLRLEMTGVYLTGSSRPTPFPKFAEGHLAVCNSAACVVSFIAHLTGRCFAKADALPLIC
ncbi:MAG TPA: hypothetical protein VKV29_09570 [Chthonomonas sp.]|uniref:hypothetical protein n=1 Tax=Chthonomonas sp. TaxID=2282153 RepID=UPI002B4AE436|nr:hypothetical protein [Chthonomonas sp.]HLH80515.1 hypothetical protein [Chthonomonas sp.]